MALKIVRYVFVGEKQEKRKKVLFIRFFEPYGSKYYTIYRLEPTKGHIILVLAKISFIILKNKASLSNIETNHLKVLF
jgi:hypothetical protein